MSSHPKVIVVANGKGGVGNSYGIVWYFSEKYKVLAVDADSQGSFFWWASRVRKASALT